jgi:hypothetical protein
VPEVRPATLAWLGSVHGYRHYGIDADAIVAATAALNFA